MKKMFALMVFLSVLSTVALADPPVFEKYTTSVKGEAIKKKHDKGERNFIKEEYGTAKPVVPASVTTTTRAPEPIRK